MNNSEPSNENDSRLFCVAAPHESFMNTHARALKPLSFFLREFNTIATSFQRPMTIVVPSHSGLPKRLPAAGDGRTETQLCVSVPFFWWLNKIHTLRVDLLEEGRRSGPAVIEQAASRASAKRTEARSQRKVQNRHPSQDECEWRISRSLACFDN